MFFTLLTLYDTYVPRAQPEKRQSERFHNLGDSELDVRTYNSGATVSSRSFVDILNGRNRIALRSMLPAQSTTSKLQWVTFRRQDATEQVVQEADPAQVIRRFPQSRLAGGGL